MSQEAIAQEIENHLGQLIEIWISAVRDDPRIESDATLSTPELIDHVPAIIQEICALIRKNEVPNVRNSHEARANVYLRYQQGYKGRDLIRELSLLRITLLDHLKEISADKASSFASEDVHNAGKILNLYLDEEMRYAISVYGSAPSAPETSVS
jgi:RsbRD-like negative regulator of sigma factor